MLQFAKLVFTEDLLNDFILIDGKGILEFPSSSIKKGSFVFQGCYRFKKNIHAFII